jgi:hypothetical protein
MSTYGIKNAIASLHLRLPKSMLAEMRVVAAKKDSGGMSALVRRAVRQYILMQQNGGKARPPGTNKETSVIPQQPQLKNESVEDELERARRSHNLYFNNEA